MFKLNYFFKTTLLSAIILVQFACKDGAAGVAGTPGTTGAQGPQGVAGANGASGTNGKDGNANVVGKVFTFQVADWTKVTYGTMGKYDYGIAVKVPEITQSVVDKGMVVAYRSNGNGAFTALPASYAFEGASKVYVISFSVIHGLGRVTFYRSDSDGLTLPPTEAETYKIVVITPQGRIANPNVNYNDYAEVAKAFNLE